MATLKDLCNIEFGLVKSTQAGNIYSGNKQTVLLKPVNREYGANTKKPVYYLNLIEKGKAAYLTGLFATNDESVFSGDYKDIIGVKHIVKLIFSDGGKAMTLQAVA